MESSLGHNLELTGKTTVKDEVVWVKHELRAGGLGDSQSISFNVILPLDG